MDRIEMLARMWMECDPTRGDNPFSADFEVIMRGKDGVVKARPYWNYYASRAEAALAHFEKHGFALSPAGK